MKVIDCTIRDGGLMNKWDFSHDLVKKVYKANADAGVDYMEIGYKANTQAFDPKEYGPWRFCNEEDLNIITEGIDTPMKLSMMVDIGRCTEEDILPCGDSKIDTIRVACYAHQVDEAIKLANSCIDKGYETFINIMAVTTVSEAVISGCLVKIEETSKVKGIYVVDSFGSIDLEKVGYLIKKYQRNCPSLEIGFHGHNNQQLAFSNTLVAMLNGATYLDASFYLMLRGAGNCPLEILLPAIKNTKYDISPIIQVIEDDFLPLMEKLKWGYRLPYAVTGVLNEHPRSGMAYMEDREGKTISDFYSQLNTKEVSVG